MSNSSLWVMDKNFNGEELIEFKNSWLFSPVSWDILLEKYIPKKPFESKRSFLSATMFDKTIHGRLNEKLNNSEVQEDRVLWEMSNQQVFFTKDKVFIVNSIKMFLKTNKEYATELEEHIHDRFNEIAEEILKIDENEYPFLIFKNTSCDDNVEYWFSKYDEESDEYIDRSLKELNERVTEFVNIENEIIKGFTSNLDYFS
ncbi:MAG: hypothetical protein Q8936_01825 [Bacillota bacterium]|nr:hypothetical protein [Bacillota bacterium]